MILSQTECLHIVVSSEMKGGSHHLFDYNILTYCSDFDKLSQGCRGAQQISHWNGALKKYRSDTFCKWWGRMKTTVLKPEKYSLIEAVFACHEASAMVINGYNNSPFAWASWNRTALGSKSLNSFSHREPLKHLKMSSSRSNSSWRIWVRHTWHLPPWAHYSILLYNFCIQVGSCHLYLMLGFTWQLLLPWGNCQLEPLVEGSGCKRSSAPWTPWAALGFGWHSLTPMDFNGLHWELRTCLNRSRLRIPQSEWGPLVPYILTPAHQQSILLNIIVNYVCSFQGKKEQTQVRVPVSMACCQQIKC